MSTSCDDFDDDFSPIPKDFSEDSTLTEFILRKAQELKIRKFGQDLPVVPTEGNGYTVITKTTVVLDDQREFTKIHCICGQKHGIQDVEQLVFESLASSTVQAIEMVEHLPVSDQVIMNASAGNEFFPASASQKKEYKHRRDMLISPKQFKTIQDIAKQKRLHPETYVKKHMGSRELNALNRAEANEVIQALMKDKVVSSRSIC